MLDDPDEDVVVDLAGGAAAASRRAAARGRTACRRTPARRAPRPSAGGRRSTLPLNMTTGIASTPCFSRTRRSISQPSTIGISRPGGSGRAAPRRARRALPRRSRPRAPSSRRTSRLTRRSSRRPESSSTIRTTCAWRRCAGAAEELVEIALAEPPVAARRVEGGQATAVGPLPDRALRDAEVRRGLAEREPVGRSAFAAPTWMSPVCHQSPLQPFGCSYPSRRRRDRDRAGYGRKGTRCERPDERLACRRASARPRAPRPSESPITKSRPAPTSASAVADDAAPAARAARPAGPARSAPRRPARSRPVVHGAARVRARRPRPGRARRRARPRSARGGVASTTTSRTQSSEPA